MTHETSKPLKFAYCVVLLSAILPFGPANSGWVAMATGGAGMSTIPLIGPLVLLVLGLYRIYIVAQVPHVLDSPQATGFAAFMRKAGAFLIYFGLVVTVLRWTATPLMKMFMTTRTESGAEFFAVAVYLSLAAGLGMMGLLSFEFSRLLSFERSAQIPATPSPRGRPVA